MTHFRPSMFNLQQCGAAPWMMDSVGHKINAQKDGDTGDLSVGSGREEGRCRMLSGSLGVVVQ
ncbi:hypothetical protein TSUD_357630 [Trifolium subterraneum]|uniref:Uncharacterized protein n=1 Tax=Trifolium subterraneum TaxID=3900 RepID=A0A2Z6NGJ2_TRISU|nr:hypothetical protein TSUD_357630 [Trifolium subterraneum]